MDNGFFDDIDEELVDGSSLDESQVIYNEPPNLNSSNKRKRNNNTDGKKKVTNPVNKAKDTAASAVDTAGTAIDTTGKAISGAGKTVNAAGKGIEAAGKGVEVAGKGMQMAGKGAKAVGSGLNAAGSAATEAGAALSSTGIGAIAGVPLAALGTVANAAGTGMNAAGTGLDAAGKGTEAAGKGMQKAGKTVQKTGKQIDKTGKNISKTGKDIKNKANDMRPKLRSASNKSSVPTPSMPTGSNNSKSYKVADRLKKRADEIKEAITNPTSLKGQITRIKYMIILGAAGLLLSLFMILLIFGPIMDVMDKLGEVFDSAKAKIQIKDNLYSGFGANTTKDAFFEEAKYLYDYYDEQLDLPLIMATLFYNEKQGYGTSEFGLEGQTGSPSDEDLSFGGISTFLKNQYKSIFEEVDENGRKYTIGKIYRLRMLAKNQLDTSIPTSTEEVEFSEFIQRAKERLSSDVYQLFESLPSLLNPLDFGRKINDIINLLDGSETFETVSIFNAPEVVVATEKLVKELFVMMADISSISLSFSPFGFVVNIHKYEINLDNYEDYLREYYIPNMPEFKKQLDGLSDEKKEEKIKFIINDIYEYADMYEEIFGYEHEAGSSDYSEQCIGNVDSDLVSMLGLPVKGTSYNFTGTNGYGIVGSSLNNGLNLTKETAGVNAGDDVYSIYGGKVVDVKKKCKTNSNKCDDLGNYVIIKHEDIRSDGKVFNITSTYANLDSVTVSKNNKVKKGEKIGTIGKTGSADENMLHFEIKDEKSGSNLNPTNLFVPCADSSISSVCGKNVQEKVWSYFVSNGFSKEATAGIMGNIEQESSFNPANIQNGGTGKAAGLFQLEDIQAKSGRWLNLYNYSKKHKKEWKELDVQLDFMHKKDMDDQFRLYTGHGVHRYSTGALAWWPKKITSSQYKNIKDINEATEIFERVFERAGIPKMENRYAAAKKYYRKYKNFTCATENSSNGSQIPRVNTNLLQNFKIESYINELIKMANNNKIGYSQSTRYLNPNVDCSSFIYYGLVKAGILKGNSPFTTSSMGSILKAHGFKQIKYSRDKLQRGDILVKPGNHTTTYLGSGMEAAAHSNYDGRNGDSSGREVSVNKMTRNDYMYIYRYIGK